MIKQNLPQQLKELIDRVGKAQTDRLSELAKIAGLSLATDYVGVDLSGEDLSGDNLHRANLSDTDLSDTDLSDTDLSDTDLSDTNLSRANLSRANLSRANLSRANLIDTKVEKTHFGDNLGLTEEMKFDLKRRGSIFKDSNRST